MKQSIGQDERMRWFIGDVRDQNRLYRALHNVDVVVHAAALKQVDTAEQNPSEYVKTNVLGSQNLIEASIDAKVKRVVALSTDKASSPINLYGATKLTADKLFVSASIYAGAQDTKFSVVRYGNVFGSRGSVAPYFSKLRNTGLKLTVTDVGMTRFWLTLGEAISMVTLALNHMKGGELYVPKIPSIRILDLVEAFNMINQYVVTGIRPGEKLHEEMISLEESRRCWEQDNYYILYNSETGENSIKGRKVLQNFCYSSGTNQNFLTVDQIRSQLLAAGLL
jgi:UDP-N-acetylglucosamine 4,6-dehydratase